MKIKNWILATCVLITMNVLADISVSDVQVFSGFPWKEVVIGYRITGSSDNGFVLSVTAAKESSSVILNKKTWLMSDSAGDYRIVKWDGFQVDWLGLGRISKWKFTVKVAALDRYCVVDLSQGTSASNYPVTYLKDVPSGGWTDEYKTTKLVLRRIDAGTFIMGGGQANEAHRVTLTKPFYMGVFEVTQKQWSLVMGEDPCSSTSYGKGDNYPVHYVSYSEIRGHGEGWPVSSVAGPGSFLGNLSRKTGMDFDLPTEAQWEYACRAGMSTTYYWGNSMDDDYAWYYADSNSGKAMHPVGMKKPNAWGLYDMSGNVWEWNLNWYGILSYGTDPKGLSSGTYRTLRGGCFCSFVDECESGSRRGESPSTVNGTFGFRLVTNLSK